MGSLLRCGGYEVPNALHRNHSPSAPLAPRIPIVQHYAGIKGVARNPEDLSFGMNVFQGHLPVFA